MQITVRRIEEWFLWVLLVLESRYRAGRVMLVPGMCGARGPVRRWCFLLPLTR